MGSYPTPTMQEVLPPAPGNQSPRPVRRHKPAWAIAPATHVLVGVNCLVFLAMTLRGVSALGPSSLDLLHWGADNAGLVLLYGEWWRILTAMFVHVGILHLATNMWCLWNLGLLAEPLLGSGGVLAVYLLTGAAGNLLSTAENWRESYHELADLIHKFHGHVPPFGQIVDLFPAGAGASGAVFGIAGAVIVLLKSPRLPMPLPELKKLRRSVIYFAVLNLVLGLSISGGNMLLHSDLNIDNMAHLGGFICGLLFAAPLVPRIGSPRSLFQVRLRLAVGMTGGMLVLFAVFLNQLPG